MDNSRVAARWVNSSVTSPAFVLLPSSSRQLRSNRPNSQRPILPTTSDSVRSRCPSRTTTRSGSPSLESVPMKPRASPSPSVKNQQDRPRAWSTPSLPPERARRFSPDSVSDLFVEDRPSRLPTFEDPLPETLSVVQLDRSTSSLKDHPRQEVFGIERRPLFPPSSNDQHPLHPPSPSPFHLPMLTPSSSIRSLDNRIRERSRSSDTTPATNLPPSRRLDLRRGRSTSQPRSTSSDVHLKLRW